METEVIRPQKNYFLIAEKANGTSNAFAIAAGLFALITAILAKSIPYLISHSLWNIVSTSVAVFLALGACVSKIVYACSMHDAETERRRGFVDNAFNVKLSSVKSERYYDTDDIPFGVPKLLADMHQSCLSTERITQLMIKRCIPRLVVMAIVLIVFAAIGFGKVVFIEPMLNLLVAGLLLRDILSVFLLYKETREIESATRALWESVKTHDNNESIIANVVYLVIRYECALTRANIILDEKIYEQTRQELLHKWGQIRSRHDI